MNQRVKRNFIKFLILTFITFTSLASVTQVLAAGTYDWNGQWQTDDLGRTYNFIQQGSTVTGYIVDEPDFKFEGTAVGKGLSGKWSRPPYSEPDYAGTMTLTMSDDGQSVIGKWKYGTEAAQDDLEWFNFSGVKEASTKQDISIILSATVSGDTVDLTWNGSSSSNSIQGYNIYRSTQPGKEGSTPINVAPIKDDSGLMILNYADQVAVSGTYYYTCKAVFLDKTLSNPSNEVKLDVSLQTNNADNNTTTNNSGNDNSQTNAGNDTGNVTSDNTGNTGDNTGSTNDNTQSVQKTNNIVLYAGNPIMTVNGSKVEIDEGRGTAPIIVNNRTLVPIRAVVEALGGTVNWDANEQKVTIKGKDSKVIELWIGKNYIRVAGVKGTMDVAPMIYNGRTVLPLRFVSENLGCEVKWDAAEKKATLIY